MLSLSLSLSLSLGHAPQAHRAGRRASARDGVGARPTHRGAPASSAAVRRRTLRAARASLLVARGALSRGRAWPPAAVRGMAAYMPPGRSARRSRAPPIEEDSRPTRRAAAPGEVRLATTARGARDSSPTSSSAWTSTTGGCTLRELRRRLRASGGDVFLYAMHAKWASSTTSSSRRSWRGAGRAARRRRRRAARAVEAVWAALFLLLHAKVATRRGAQSSAMLACPRLDHPPPSPASAPPHARAELWRRHRRRRRAAVRPNPALRRRARRALLALRLPAGSSAPTPPSSPSVAAAGARGDRRARPADAGVAPRASAACSAPPPLRGASSRATRRRGAAARPTRLASTAASSSRQPDAALGAPSARRGERRWAGRAAPAWGSPARRGAAPAAARRGALERRCSGPTGERRARPGHADHVALARSVAGARTVAPLAAAPDERSSNVSTVRPGRRSRPRRRCPARLSRLGDALDAHAVAARVRGARAASPSHRDEADYVGLVAFRGARRRLGVVRSSAARRRSMLASTAAHRPDLGRSAAARRWPHLTQATPRPRSTRRCTHAARRGGGRHAFAHVGARVPRALTGVLAFTPSTSSGDRRAFVRHEPARPPPRPSAHFKTSRARSSRRDGSRGLDSPLHELMAKARRSGGGAGRDGTSRPAARRAARGLEVLIKKACDSAPPRASTRCARGWCWSSARCATSGARRQARVRGAARADRGGAASTSS